jgi:oligoendopeptidase F
MTWDLTTIFATEEAWEADFKKVQDSLGKFAAFKGRLGRSGRILLEALTLSNEVGAIMGRLYLYAHLSSDVDTTVSHFAGLKQRALKLYSQLETATSWMEPEMLRIKPERLEKFIEKNAGLAIYRQKFRVLQREAAHVLSPQLEEILASASVALGSASTIHDQLDDADMKLPMVTMPDGTEVELSHGNFGDVFLRSQDPEVRKRGFEAMMGAYKALRHTYTACYAGSVASNIFTARTRNYTGARNAALSSINVPESVYDNLLATIETNLPVLHRYLALRKKVMGVDELHMYDLYAPLVKGADRTMTYEEAKALVLSAVTVLGDDYVKVLGDGYESRWIDVLENEGKASGAYQYSMFGTNPFMLLNWVDSIENAFTLGHESGHAMHSYYSKSRQPYPYAGYTIFVAEVASTVNEQLMAHHLLKTVTDPNLRLHIINRQLEAIRTTIIRQALFAEFEHEAYKLAEADKPLTPDALAALYKSIVTKYYGASCVIDESIESEWMRIGHFYNAFYVYQYATGLSAACALVNGMLKEGKPAVDRYLAFLSAGKSKDSIDLLKDAGVDMTSTAPVQAAFDMFAEYLDLFEKELAAHA